MTSLKMYIRLGGGCGMEEHKSAESNSCSSGALGLSTCSCTQMRGESLIAEP